MAMLEMTTGEWCEYESDVEMTEEITGSPGKLCDLCIFYGNIENVHVIVMYYVFLRNT